MLIYADNQGRSNTSFIILRCEPAQTMKLVLQRPCS